MHKPWQWLETEARRKLKMYHAEADLSQLLVSKSPRRRLAEAFLKLAAGVDLEVVQALARQAKFSQCLFEWVV